MEDEGTREQGNKGIENAGIGNEERKSDRTETCIPEAWVGAKRLRLGPVASRRCKRVVRYAR